MGRVLLPAGFRWGAAAAADSAETADVALLSALNLTTYRFPIPWSRILPNGRRPVSEEGVDLYRRLSDELLAAGVRPFPTLCNGDLPQTLQHAGGWANRDTAGRFADYVEVIARALGDRVDTWCPINEPGVFTWSGTGVDKLPGISNPEVFLRAYHVAHLAQGEAFRALRAERADARIGSAFRCAPCEPYGDSDSDREAALRLDALLHLGSLEPALRGRYADVFLEEPPLDAMDVRDGDLERLRAPFDFIGINLAPRILAAHAHDDPTGVHARQIDEPSAWDPSGHADAVHRALMELTRSYEHPTLEITDWDLALDDEPQAERPVDDAPRIERLRGSLTGIARAIEDGADVGSHHAGSLLDGFDDAEKTRRRSGLVWANFSSGERIPKRSGRWYAQVAAENGFET